MIDTIFEESRTTPIVDFAESAGPVRAIHGINLGPLSYMGAVDASEYFKEIEFPLVRLHDCPYFYRKPVVDIPLIFPLDHLDADDPANYVFKPTDGYVQSIVDCNCPIIYRLGVSIEGTANYRCFTDPPKDVDKWIAVASNIIRHYNEGWGNGFEHGIRYWEIWNEPDNGPSQWAGTFNEFTDFYIRVSKALKERFPELMIGGPALNGGMLSDATAKLDQFLPYVAEAEAPLDFLSWHVYPRRPGELVRSSNEVRGSLDKYGFMKTESHCNEWNIGPVDNNWGLNGADNLRKRANFEEMKSIRNCALVAASYTALQDIPVDMTNFYHASNVTRGIFDEFGKPHKVFYAFRAFKQMLLKTPQRCHVEDSDPDQGLAVLPGISEDRKTVQLLLTNYAKDRESWNISIKNLPVSNPKIETWIIDDYHDFEPGKTDQAVLEGSNLSVRVPQYTVCLVTMGTNT